MNKTPEEIKLKPCPFCGSSANLQCFHDKWFVICLECWCHTSSEEIDIDATQQWNNRTGEAQSRQEAVDYKVLEEALKIAEFDNKQEGQNFVLDVINGYKEIITNQKQQRYERNTI